MALTIHRIGPGDDAILALLALEDPDFDLEGRSAPREPLSQEQSERYLANPAVLHWVASDGEHVLGFLYCLLVPLRSGAGEEVLLYEIGVRRAARRHGVGRALIEHLAQWMQAHEVQTVWVLADNPGAVEFYRACGFAFESAQPVYMTRALSEDRSAQRAP